MATVVDVAARAGVSIAVVSRVLNGDDRLRVRDETRQRVLDAAAELNYTPNHAARALAQSRAHILGLAVHDASNPLYSPIIAGAQSAAAEHGYALMLADVEALARDDQLFRRLVSSGSVDGIVLQRAATESDALIERIASSRIPIVLMNESSERPEVSSVAVDDEEGAYVATRHLISLGHRRIAHLRVDGPPSRNAARTRGWERALREADLPVDGAPTVPGGHLSEQGFHAMRALLERRDSFTAVFAANPLVAIGALRACADAGVGVPSDVSLVALHDIALAEFITPRLTTVRMPLYEMGRRAVELALMHLDRATAQQELIRPAEPEIVARASTAAPSRTT